MTWMTLGLSIWLVGGGKGRLGRGREGGGGRGRFRQRQGGGVQEDCGSVHVTVLQLQFSSSFCCGRVFRPGWGAEVWSHFKFLTGFGAA